MSTVVSQQQIESLPINGRNFISFSVITPGVSTDRTPQQGASATSGLTFAGQRARSNNITVDGLDNNDAALGSVRATFSQEAVREFQVLTNSYSAEFGKASGGVVNIVTKSGTNTPFGQRVLLLPRRCAEREGPLREVRSSRHSRSTGTRRRTARSSSAAPWAARSKRTRRSSSCRSSGSTSATSNFVTIDDTTPCARPAGGFLGTPAGILRARRFPGRDRATFRMPSKATQFLAKVDHQLSPDQSLVLRFNYADALNENIEPFGGHRGEEPRRLARQPRLHGSPRRTPPSSASRVGQRAAVPVRAARSARRLARSELRRSMRAAKTRAGPTLEVLGVASVGRQRFTPQPRLNDRYQVLDTLSYFARQSPAQVRLRLQLHRQHERVAAAAFRRALYFRPRCRRIPGSCPCRSRHPGGRARAAGRLRPGLRPLAQPRTATRTSRSSRRTTGA